nr:RNA-directed DNA polymerase, eukaryota [Tanacetum cinerariifolium]
LNEKRDLWDYLRTFIDRWEGDTVIMSDFNELKKKLQALKIAIKAWSKEANKRSNDRKINIQQNLSEVDKLIDQGKGNDDIFIKRITLLNDLQELNNRNAMKISQKAKIRWSIEDQFQDLERTVTYEEVKRAVWDCGTNKSPGPDGFSFEFYHFRPISLVGSIYKIIAKILANRLCVVLPYLISDVQSAFVANRQILDGPFILNELLSWCKFKKLNGMIFKVDFEKAFDSVKWDYLDETLKAFGFGSKWRNWISSCLNNALINGSPTLEFQFHKGLKQGDPISPFLFILIMETLHLTFKRVLNAGLYKGISLKDSFMIYHLFYADDVVFIGVKINLHKSKLMGTGVSSNVVAAVAFLIGCFILTAPFNYLGVKVGSNISPWQDVILAIHSLQSKGINLMDFIQKKVGNGENTFFWDDSWLGEVALKVLYKRLYALEMCKSISVAEKMGHPSLSHSFRRMPRGGVEQKNYGLLCSKVADFVLPNILDRWCWSLEGSQEFSVKSSRILIDNTILLKAEVSTRCLRVVPIKKSIALWEFSTKACSLIR